MCLCCGQVGEKVIPMEVYLLQKVKHIRGVVPLIDLFEDADSFVLVLDRPHNAQVACASFCSSFWCFYYLIVVQSSTRVSYIMLQ